MKKIFTVLSALACLTGAVQAQNVTVQHALGQSPEAFVRNHLMGTGTYVFNVKYNNGAGPISSPQIGTFNTNGNTSYGAQEGICLSNGDIIGIAGPNGATAQFSVDPYYTDPQMDALSYEASYNHVTACSTLEFDFVSLTNNFSFNYLFASEEYSCCVGSQYTDLFALLLTGPDPATGMETTRNIAIVPNSVTDTTPNGVVVSVNTVNNGVLGFYALFFGTAANFTDAYGGFYVDNPYDAMDSAANVGIGYDGYTNKLTAQADILPCQVYHMKISICNVSDNAVDSGVLLEGGSFQSPSAQIGLTRMTVDTVPGSCGLGVPLTLAQVDAFDAGTVHFAFGGEAVYGTDYELVDERGRALDSTGLAIDNEEHSFVVRALPGADLSEPKSIELYLLTSLCPQFPELVTHDTMRFVLVRGGDVRVADTTITCSQACFEVSAPLVYGDESTTYRWEPTTGLANPYSLTTAAAIFESADYQLIATGGSGCNSDTALVHVVVTGTQPDPPVGIEDEVGSRKSEVSVWPNPAGDVIHIEADGLRRVELYSLDGRLVGSGRPVAGSGRISLPTEGLANGTYGLRIVTAEGTTASKIVINR